MAQNTHATQSSTQLAIQYTHTCQSHSYSEIAMKVINSCETLINWNTIEMRKIQHKSHSTHDVTNWMSVCSLSFRCVLKLWKRFVKTFWSFHVTFAYALLRLNDFHKITECCLNSDCSAGGTTLSSNDLPQLTSFGRQKKTENGKMIEPVKFLPAVHGSYRLRFTYVETPVKWLSNFSIVFRIHANASLCVSEWSYSFCSIFYIKLFPQFSVLDFNGVRRGSRIYKNSVYTLHFKSTWFDANAFQALVALSTRDSTLSWFGFNCQTVFLCSSSTSRSSSLPEWVVQNFKILFAWREDTTHSTHDPVKTSMKRSIRCGKLFNKIL